jgi:hypothetical protein
MSVHALAILVILPPVLAVVPAEIARRKHRSFAGFWLFGVVFLPFAITTAILVRSGSE